MVQLTKQEKEVQQFVEQVKSENGEVQVRFLTMSEDPELFRGLLSDAYVDEALIRKGILTVEQVNAKYKEESFEEMAKRLEAEL